MIRKAAVAGRFYPEDPQQLHRFFDEQLRTPEVRLEAHGIIVPHAGYPYSGGVAARVYSAVELPRRFIILCPNHTGLGPRLAVMSEGTWETPLGKAEIDQDLATRIREAFPGIEENATAHRDEHSLEVQLPFLQRLLANDFRFVPICVGTSVFEILVGLGQALGAVVSRLGEGVLLVASSDMNHFESSKVTMEKDELAISRVLELDSSGLYETVRRYGITMCGYAPTISVMEASRRLGATKGILIDHTHSGVATGENSRVVGYAGIALC